MQAATGDTHRRRRARLVRLLLLRAPVLPRLGIRLRSRARAAPPARDRTSPSSDAHVRSRRPGQSSCCCARRPRHCGPAGLSPCRSHAVLLQRESSSAPPGRRTQRAAFCRLERARRSAFASRCSARRHRPAAPVNALLHATNGATRQAAGASATKTQRSRRKADVSPQSCWSNRAAVSAAANICRCRPSSQILEVMFSDVSFVRACSSLRTRMYSSEQHRSPRLLPHSSAMSARALPQWVYTGDVWVVTNYTSETLYIPILAAVAPETRFMCGTLPLHCLRRHCDPSSGPH